MRAKLYLLIVMAMACSACTSSTQLKSSPLKAHISKSSHLPWTISHLAPDYMEAYLNGIVVFDIQKNMHPNVLQGSPSMRLPPLSDAAPAGWPANPGWGGVTPVGSDLPQTLIINWRSFVEQQEYYVRVEISEDTRKEMTKANNIACFKHDGLDTYHRNNIVVGLAPGGIAKLWINGPCLDSIQAGRYVAQKIEEGEARAALSKRELAEETQEYLKHHRIPYDSW